MSMYHNLSPKLCLTLSKTSFLAHLYEMVSLAAALAEAPEASASKRFLLQSNPVNRNSKHFIATQGLFTENFPVNHQFCTKYKVSY